MERYYGRLKSLWARVAHFAAAFAMSATLLLAVVSAFYTVSSEPVRAESPEATRREAVKHARSTGRRGAASHFPADQGATRRAVKADAVFAYPLTPDGSVGPRRTLVDYWGRRTGIDGMAVDVEGNIYAARVSAIRQDRGIAVFSPSGQELAFVPTADNPTNVAFGRGDERRTLYVTARANLLRIKILKDGFHPFDK